jgi:hypothetical protein
MAAKSYGMRKQGKEKMLQTSERTALRFAKDSL